MSKIKKFFARKKEEASFKLKLGGGMGRGQALNAPKPEPSSSQRKPRDVYVPPKRNEVSAEARVAAAAALSRIENKTSKEFNTSLAAIKARAKRELEAERKLREELSAQALGTASQAATAEAVPVTRNLACEGVFFRCPIISDEVLPRKEWKVKIREFLYQQLELERGLTSCLIIYNCNTKEKTEDCVQTLSKYLENIVQHPNEEKYYKIRMSNKIFCDKVRYVEGALDFLHAAGFREVELDGEPFLLYGSEHLEQEYDLPSLLEGLKSAEIISLELDRNIKVLLPSQARRTVLPDDFYRMTPEEIKREQQLRSEAIQQAQILKTKAMREREEQRNLRLYRYALVRVKFPDGIFIQGTFNVYEKMRDVFDFVRSCLLDEDLEFELVDPGSGKLGEDEMDKTLFELRLIPSLTLLFSPPGETVATSSDKSFLKEQLLMLVQSM